MTRRGGWVGLLAVLAATGCRFGPEQAVVERVIADGWEFRRAGDTLWLPATVPGTVHTDLLANGVIPDPFYGDNERRLQWIERKTLSDLKALGEEIAKMLNSLVNSIKSSKN